MSGSAFHKQVNIVLKILGHSCEIEKNGKITRSKLFIFYIMLLYGALARLIDSERIPEIETLINKAVVFSYILLLIFSLLTSLFQEKEYHVMLQLASDFQREIGTEEKSVRGTLIIASFYSILVLDVISLIQQLCRLYWDGYTATFIPLLVVIVKVLGTGSFARALVIMSKFLSLSHLINTKTRASVNDFDAIKRIMRTVMAINVNFSRLNHHLSPYLLATLGMSFTTLSHFPFVLVTYFNSTKTFSHLDIVCQFLKFLIISNVCHQFHNDIVQWWQIVEDTPGFIEDMLLRGITPSTGKSLKINVYGLFEVDKSFIKNMLLVVLNYSFLVTQMSPRFTLFVMWLKSPAAPLCEWFGTFIS